MAKNNSTIINLDNTETAVKMFDKFARLGDGRRIQPLDSTDNIIYTHRAYYDNYNLQIGDTYFMIPPEFIMVNSESPGQSIVMLRQENTQKLKSGYHKRIILIDLVFNGIEQLNGYTVNGPEGIYYVDGLRQLLAQFKCAPFLPIVNETINGTYAIFNVALQSITMSTLDGFPGVMTAQVTLQEVNLTPYIEMPDPYFKYIIDWDLFRYYYQRFLTNKHEYKKLQSLPYNREFNHFKISILDLSVFSSNQATKKNLLNLITDKEIVRVDDDGNPCDTNYVTYVDSAIDDAMISSFQCGYSNILTNIQLSDAGSPTLQYLGGMDTIYNITFETRDYKVVQALESCQINNDVLTRKNIKLRSVGFVKLESELVEFTGSLFVVIESVTTNTVPGFPGLYNVQMNCVAYDIGQSEREQLKGFMPFTGKGNESHTIDQSWSGLKEKVRQDCYAEWKIRTKMEVYPDMHLPTYNEVNRFIKKCIAFRANNNLSELPYTEYPVNPCGILSGNKASNKEVNGDLVYACDVPKTYYEYDIFVDPDFYVFYPSSYESFLKDDPDYYGVTPNQRESFTKDISTSSEEYGTDPEDLRKAFIDACKSQIGKAYAYGGDGIDKKGFDDAGLITYGLKKIGVMSANKAKLTANSIPSSDLFEEADPSDLQAGDVVINNSNHVMVYTGEGRTVHASMTQTAGQAAMLGNGVGSVQEGVLKDGYRVFKPKFDKLSYNQTIEADSENDLTDTLNQTYSMNKEDFDSICEYIQGEAVGENYSNYVQYSPKQYGEYEGSETYKALAQYIFDSITNTGVSLNTVLTSGKFKGSKSSVIPAIEDAVKDVFCNNKKQYTNKVKDFLSDSASKATIENRDSKYKRLKDLWGSKHLFWGDKRQKSLDICYTIYEDGVSIAGNGSPSPDGDKVTYEAVMLTSDNLQHFAEPVLARVARMKYGIYDDEDGWTWENFMSGDHRTFSREELNSGVNIFNTSFCDMYQYSCRGRLVRAFPAYLFCILDDNAQWFDGRKLWTNYYTHRSAVDIAVHSTNDMATSTATITITNSYHNLDITQGGLSKYKITNDPEYFGNTKEGDGSFKQWWYKTTGLVPSFNGPKVTETLMELHSQIYENAKLREGARIHLRMGYGSDPFGLAPMINGHISDIALGDQITMVVTSDGNELISHITSSGEKNESDTNNGFFGLFGLFESQEASDIIAGIMSKRQGWLTKINKNWFEGSKYGIEHFGLYFKQNLFESINNVWAGKKEQYDIMKNVYTSNYEREHYVTCRWIRDDEENVVFNKYNMTPWDVFQVCTQQAPEYILKASMHQFDSRLYYGLPLWMEKYRYNLYAGVDIQEKKEKTISGDSKDGNGKFNENENEYDSGQIITNGKGRITSVTFHVKMDDSHTNASKEDPDVVDIISYYEDGTTYTYHAFSGNLKGKEHTFGLPTEYLNRSKIVNVQIKVHVPQSHEHCCHDANISWDINFAGTSSNADPVDTGGLFDECKASTQCHFIDSLCNIIDNQVKVTSKFTNTNMKVMYTRGDTVLPTKTLMSDSTIDNAYQKTSIMDSSIVQDAFGPDAIFEWLGLYKIGEKSAKRVGISNLLYGWQQQYQGQLLLLGEPGIKPHDYIMLNDGYVNMYGISVVREVIHSFNTNTGFTTSVTPGMIGFSTAQDSGLIVSCQNMLMMLKMFSAFVNARRDLIKNYEHYINIFANLETLRAKFITAYNNNQLYGNVLAAENTIAKPIMIGCTVKAIIKLKNAAELGEVVSTFVTGVKGVKFGIAGLKTIYASLLTATKAAAKLAGPGYLIALAITFIIDKIVNAIFEWLSNKNVVCLLPMWWNDYPFVNNVKDGKKILLMGSNDTETGEGRTDERGDNIDPDKDPDLEDNE